MARKKNIESSTIKTTKEEKEQNIADIFSTSPSNKKEKKKTAAKKTTKKTLENKNGNEEKTKKNDTVNNKKDKKKETNIKTVSPIIENEDNNNEIIKLSEKKYNTINTITVTMIIILLILLLILLNISVYKIEKKLTAMEPVIEYINPKTIFFGDSITSRYDLDKYFENDNYINQGIGGNKTTDLLKRMKKSIYDYNPERVVLLIGVNDLNTDSSIEDIATNISLIIKKIKKNNSKTKIYVESILPINKNESEDKIDANASGKRSNKKIKELNKEIKNICTKLNVVFINTYDEFINEDGELKLEYTEEGLHLSNAGYQKLTEILNKYLNEKHS